MGPQCEDGYTKIANELLEALYKVRVPGESMQIFLMILRKTYGYGKKEDRIALCQFQETGIGKTHIPRAIAKLISMNIVTKKGNGYNVTYGINKHYNQWQALPKKVTLPNKVTGGTEKGKGGTEKGNESTPKRDTQKTKEISTKETLQKKGELFPICKAWHAFKAMRKSIKKPLTPFAEGLIVKKLVEFESKGHDPTTILHNSIENSWQGVFEPKEKTNGHRFSGNVGKDGKAKRGGIIEANPPETEWL